MVDDAHHKGNGASASRRDAAGSHEAGSLLVALSEREKEFRAPEPLLPLLESVRNYLMEELSEGAPESLSLVRAALVCAVGIGNCPPERLVPLAAGMEMIFHALTAQQTAVPEGGQSDLFGILTHDLVLARALDLYTTDGDARVMDAVSRGSAHLCEALMAERSGAPFADTMRYASLFYGACARVGASAAGVAEEEEIDRAAAVENALKANVENALKTDPGTAKEDSSVLTNRGENGNLLLSELLFRWTSETNFSRTTA